MSSGPNINIVSGLSGDQMHLEQLESVFQAIENEARIAQELHEIDFFVGPNGKVLPSALLNWIGKSRRSSLLKKAKDPALKNAINQLYRPGSFIGDGGTASIIKFEKRTGIGLGKNGGTHEQKGREMVRYIQSKILKRTNLSSSDRKLANQLIKALKKELGK